MIQSHRGGTICQLVGHAADGEEVLLCLRDPGRIPQQGGGVEDGGELVAFALRPEPVLSGDAKVGAYDALGRHPAQADHDFWPDEEGLVL